MLKWLKKILGSLFPRLFNTKTAEKPTVVTIFPSQPAPARKHEPVEEFPNVTVYEDQPPKVVKTIHINPGVMMDAIGTEEEQRPTLRRERSLSWNGAASKYAGTWCTAFATKQKAPHRQCANTLTRERSASLSFTRTNS